MGYWFESNSWLLFGTLSEWLKVHPWKGCVGANLPRVRISQVPIIWSVAREELAQFAKLRVIARLGRIDTCTLRRRKE